MRIINLYDSLCPRLYILWWTGPIPKGWVSVSKLTLYVIQANGKAIVVP